MSASSKTLINEAEEHGDPLSDYASKIAAILPELLKKEETLETLAQLLAGYKHADAYRSEDVYHSPLSDFLSQAEAALAKKK